MWQSSRDAYETVLPKSSSHHDHRDQSASSGAMATEAVLARAASGARGRDVVRALPALAALSAPARAALDDSMLPKSTRRCSEYIVKQSQKGRNWFVVVEKT